MEFFANVRGCVMVYGAKVLWPWDGDDDDDDDRSGQ